MAVPVTFSQQVLGSLCYLLSAISPQHHHTHRGQLSGTLSQCLAQLQEASPTTRSTPQTSKFCNFPLLTVPHGFTKEVFKIFCNSTLESQTSVKWEQSTWLTSREMKSLQDEEEVKHPAHRSHPISFWPLFLSSESLKPDI